MDVGQIVALLGGQAMLLAAVGWLIRTWINSSLAKDLETFKNRLTAETEAFKSQLTVEAHRQTTMFSQLHAQRNLAIAEVYGLLAAAEQAIIEMVNPVQFAGADYKALANTSALAIGAFRDKAAASRIWFTEDTCIKVDNVVIELRGIHNVFTILARGMAAGREEVNHDHWNASWKRVEEQLPGLRAALESDFRSILRKFSSYLSHEWFDCIWSSDLSF